MSRIMLVLVLLVVGLLIGPSLADNAGYVLFAVAGWTVELSLITFILIAVLFFISVFAIQRSLLLSRHMVKQSGQWLRQTKRQKPQVESSIVILRHFITNLDNPNELTEDMHSDKNPATAMSQFLHGVSLVKQQRFDDVISALKATPESQEPITDITDVANTIVYIHAAVKLSDWQAAEDALQRLPKKHPFTAQIIDYKVLVITRIHDFETALKQINTLKRQLSGEQLAQWQTRLMSQHLSQIASAEGGNAVLTHWQGLKRSHTHNANFQLAYLLLLVELGMHNQASETLLKVAAKTASYPLLSVISKLKPTQPAPVKALLEQWLKQQPTEQQLLLCYARFCTLNGELTLALASLKSLNETQPSVDSLLLAAAVYDSNQQQQLANALYRQAASFKGAPDNGITVQPR